VSESEGEEDEAADKVVELVHSPAMRSPTSPALNGDTDDVFLFDNNIPSIATRIPTSAEPAETLALRRRNRLLRLISDPRVYSRGLQRSVSVQLDDRRRQRQNSDDILGTSWPNGELDEHLTQRLTPPKSLDDDSDDAVDRAEVDRQRQDGRGQSHQSRGRAAQNRSALTTGSGGGVRRKNVISVDACCSVGSEASLMKRRGTLKGGKVVIADDLSSDDDKAELSCHLCNGLDDQPKNNNSSTSECSNKANQ